MADQDSRQEENKKEEKSYMHWLYQAVGMGNHRFLKELETLGSPKEIYELVRAGQLEEKLGKRYRKKALQMSQFTLEYDVMGDRRLRNSQSSFVILNQNEDEFVQSTNSVIKCGQSDILGAL